MNSNKIFIVLSLLLLTNCSDKKQELEEIKEVSETIPINQQTDYKQVLELPSDLRTFIFFDSAKVYALPDTLSEVVRTLKFSDNQYSLDEHIFQNNEYWYKLSGWSPDFKEGGYIKADEMSNFYTGQSKYDLGFLGKIITEKNQDYDQRSFSFKLFNTSTNEVYQEHKIPYYYSYHSIDIFYESSHKLKGVDYIFRYQTDEEQCPGRSYEEIIVSVKNKLIKLWSIDDLKVELEFNEDQNTYRSHDYTVYLPISANNKIVLAPWGNFEKLLKYDLTLDTIDCSSIDVPKTELVVVKETIEYSDNSKKEFLTYYKWDGKRLIPVKEESF